MTMSDVHCRGRGAAGAPLLASPTVRALDATDLRLLLALVGSPRASAVTLAEALGLSRNTVRARLAALTRDGAFLAFDRAVAPAAAGSPMTAFTTLRVQQRRLAEVVAELSTIPEVVQAHGIIGPGDLLVRLLCASSEDLFRVEALVLACEGVERAETVLEVGEVIPYRIAPLLRQRLGALGAGAPAPGGVE